MRARTLFQQLALALFVMITGSSLSAWSQVRPCPTCGTSESLLATATGSWTLRRQVNEVEVLFTAYRHGRFVPGLTQGDVSVRDNDKPATIVDFRGQDNLPLRIALLVDTSDSIQERFRFEKEAATVFLRQTLSSEADQAMIAGFDDRLHVMQDFTHDSALLSAGIAHLRTHGRTAVFDSVSEACRLLARPAQGMVARVLVVVSDGDDNSSMSTLKAVIARAQQAEVTVYAVGTSYQFPDFPGVKNLKLLAVPTGGEAFFPEKASKMARAFARISDELRHRYAVAYRPPELAENNRFHRIRIWARKSGKRLKVQARQGYYAR
ncbi:MAG TPA: VWA domain-containing protein [Terriglobales bacterium]|nr:VWA domain-containing protein [Terriglobales bacterium]